METEKRKATDKKEDRDGTRRKLRERQDQTNRGKTIVRQKLTETKKQELARLEKQIFRKPQRDSDLFKGGAKMKSNV